MSGVQSFGRSRESQTTAADLSAPIVGLSRSTLKAYGGPFREFELEKFNPRVLHRKLIVELEDMRLVVRSSQDEALHIDTEKFGKYTGWFESKIISAGNVFGEGSVRYRQMSKGARNLAVLLGFVGIVLLLLPVFGLRLSGSTNATTYGSALFAVGILVYIVAWARSKRSEEFSIRLGTTVGVYTKGEVTEKKVEEGGVRTTELLANGLISIGGLTGAELVNRMTPRGYAALLAVDVAAGSSPFPVTPAIRELLTPATISAIETSRDRLSQSVDEVVRRASKIITMRELKAPVFEQSKPAVSSHQLPTTDRARLQSFLGSHFTDADPKEFQSVMAMMFRGMGYEVQEQQYVGDYGADLVLTSGSAKIIVQLKKYSAGTKVGAPEVQKTIGSIPKFGALRAFLVTTSTFTDQAREQARQAPLTLVDGDELAQMLRDVLH